MPTTEKKISCNYWSVVFIWKWKWKWKFNVIKLTTLHT